VAIKVLIIDDSALMRALLTEIIGGAPDLEVVGSAPDPIAAREMIKSLNPDVLTLDVEMPKMDGLEFLSRLMKLRPMPVVMISALTARGSEVTLQALELGAVDFIAKPRAENVSLLQAYSEEIRDKIRAAKSAHLRHPPATTAAVSPRAETSAPGVSSRVLTEKLIAIGASTGGTEAIKEVIVRLPAEVPGIVIVQHMPEAFTPSFAKRLDSLGAIRVVEARGGERIQPGHAYLAPGHSHLRVRKSGMGWVTELAQSEPVNRHRPSVDVLFHSVAQEAGRNAIGVILTGMGKDGAEGLLEIRQAEGTTLGQDEASSLIYGMPRAAFERGAVMRQYSLARMADAILHSCHETKAKAHV
jgi:two-component system chemotaxis response regulator CheB